MITCRVPEYFKFNKISSKNHDKYYDRGNSRGFICMNNLVKDLKILSFKVISKCLKLTESFQRKKKFYEEYLIRRPTCINIIF